MLPTAGAAQTVTRLQVLLPGEQAAPGTASGKIGVPSAQTVGVPFTITVRACDDQWHTVAGTSDVVHVTSSDASATLPADGPLTDGQATLTVMLNAAGSFTFSASDVSDPTLPVAESAAVQTMVVQGFVFAEIHQKNQYAGQPMQIQVWAVDPAGQIVTGYNGAINLQEQTSYGLGRIEPATVDLANGTWSGPVTLYRADETSINRGNVNIYAYLAIQPEKNGTSDPFTVHPGTLAKVQIVVPGQDPAPGSASGVTGSPATQGATQPFTVDVFATDQYWNPAPCDHTVRVTSSDTQASTPVTGALVGGHVQLTLSLGTVGTQTLTVTDQTSGAIQGMTTAGIPVIPSGAHHFEFDPLPVAVQAGDPVTVTIRATDGGGNVLPDFAGDARLSANTGAGSISPEHVTFTAGVWTGEVVFRGAGAAVSLSCADYATPPHVGTSDPLQVLAGPYAGLQVLLPGQVPQGGTATGYAGVADEQAAGSGFTALIRAVDEYFNRVPSVSARVTVSSSDVNATLPDTVQLASGEASMPVTLYCAGEQTLTATDVADTVPAGTSTSVVVLPGPYTRLLILAPGEEVSPGAEDGRSGEATDQSISFAFTMTVLATDAWWNPVNGVTDQVRITCSDPMAELPPDQALVDGQAGMILRLSTGGYQQITVSNLDQPTMPTSTTQVRAISSGLHLEADIAPAVVQAGEAFTLTVRAVNDAGSVIQEINTFVDIEVRNASSQEPGCGTLLNTRFQLLQGQRTVQQTYTCAEPIVLVVSDEAGNTPAITDVLEVLPGAPDALTLEASPSWLRGNRHAAITASVVDLYENGVPDECVEFTHVSGEGLLTVLADSTSADGCALADFLSGREQGTALIAAACGELAAQLEIETAFVDPDAAGGTLTSYPNPFHPDERPTVIAYVLETDAHVRLRLWTLSGGLVLDREFAPGSAHGRAGLNEFSWDGRNGKGDPVASGGYILMVEAEAGGTTLHTMRRKIGVVR
jgi:hypothetical protein